MTILVRSRLGSAGIVATVVLLVLALGTVFAPVANAAPAQPKRWLMCHDDGEGNVTLIDGVWREVKPYFQMGDRQAGMAIPGDWPNVYDSDCSPLPVPRSTRVAVCHERTDGTTTLRNLKRQQLHPAFRAGDRRPGMPVRSDPSMIWSDTCEKVPTLDTDGDTVPDTVEVQIGQRPDLFNGVDCRSAEPLLGPGADLRGCQLQDLGSQTSEGLTIDLSGADLTEANLDGAKLLGGLFTDITAPRLSMVNALMQHSSFWRSDLSGATLDGIEVFGAGIGESNLDGASMRGASMRGGLIDVSMVGGDLTGAALYYEDTVDVDFTDAVLDGASLEYARRLNLTGASMRDFTLWPNGFIFDSTWTNAHVVDTHFSRVELTGGIDWANADLVNVTFSQTVCPDGSDSDSNVPQGCPQ